MSKLALAAGTVLGVGLLAAGVVVLAFGPPDTWPLLLRWFGPPATAAAEAYPDEGDAAFDHGVLDRLLRAHVRDGAVDYAGLAADGARLAAYLDAVAAAPWDALPRDEKLALGINAYNAFTLQLILDHRPLASIQDIPAADRWDAERWRFAGRTVSLSWLEHDELRGRFVEPRIHFAINCASVGCPPLRPEAYTADRLEAQLADQTHRLHTDPRWLRIDGRTVHLTRLYSWYAGDFTQAAGSPLAYAARYRPELAEGRWTIRWLPYDWSLNAVPSGG